MILKVSGVCKFFGGVKALDRCSFGVEKGRITAIIGPNGSGKSTVFNVISRLLKEDRGWIFFRGKDCGNLKSFEVARLGISRTFQDVRLFDNLTIRQHLEIALSDSDESLARGIFRREDDREKQALEILNLVQLQKPLTAYASDLSYGQRKLLDLATAIARPHQMLLLDEPVEGVNPGLREGIKQVLRNLNESSETVLLIEHDMNFVMDVADRVIVMAGGRVMAEGKPEEIRNDKKVLETYLGE